ncbi:MAG TPA: hypothetical protein DEP37_07065 [Algoriphagus sp.]|nr:hypothetical protein [Algoriphagus sp.]HCB46170.1 hypothetical protein [Algoriphagus sp.]
MLYPEPNISPKAYFSKAYIAKHINYLSQRRGGAEFFNNPAKNERGKVIDLIFPADFRGLIR